MEHLNLPYIATKLQHDSNALTISFDPEATTKTNIEIKVKPSKGEDDVESLKDEDLEDMMNSSDESEDEAVQKEIVQKNRPGNLSY